MCMGTVGRSLRTKNCVVNNSLTVTVVHVTIKKKIL